MRVVEPRWKETAETPGDYSGGGNKFVEVQLDNVAIFHRDRPFTPLARAMAEVAEHIAGLM